MIAFRPITIDDRDWMSEKLREDNRQGCEYSFANNFIWSVIYKVEVAEVCGCCVIKFDAEGEDCYAFPIGAGDKKAAIMQLLTHAKEDNSKLYIESIEEADREFLEKYFSGIFQIEENRDSFDYIYTVDKLTSLAGKKLHGKRNHIARFKDNEDWSYEPMSDEQCALNQAMKYFDALHLEGGILRKAGEIVAFTIGERLNSDTYVVHFEKAFPEIQGAYPMINQQFVMHNCQEYSYVNREDDAGDEGLRKAKLSYYPDILLKNYTAREI